MFVELGCGAPLAKRRLILAISCRFVANHPRFEGDAWLKVGMRTIGEDDHSIDFNDASSLKGKEPEEIERAIPADWSKNPVRSGRGTRFADPSRPGDQIRVMDGNLIDPNPVKRGPYVRISKDGIVSEPIPLKGNPTLGSGNP
jgi:hypothetical protein